MSKRIDAWVKVATKDWGVGEMIEDFDTASAAYHFQQAAEKALKALSIASGIDVVRTHNLGAIWDSLSEIEILEPATDEFKAKLNRLSLMNMVARYPIMEEVVAPSDWVSQIDVQESKATAKEVMHSVQIILGDDFEFFKTPQNDDGTPSCD